MGVIPEIEVFEQENKDKFKLHDGTAGNVAIIGAFEKYTMTPVAYSDLEKAKAGLGTDTSYDGVKCLEELFYGATSILAVSISTKDGDKIDKTFTMEKLSKALGQIEGEKFDILFIANELSDDFLPVIDEFCKKRFKTKMPVGYIGAVDRANVSAYTATAELAGRHSYGIITQQLYYDKKILNLVESAAFYCGIVAGLKVDTSMTYKHLPEGTGLQTLFSFGDGQYGNSLVKLGYTLFKCIDRMNHVFVTVNSEQFCGYDLSILRSLDFIVREMSLYDYLGKRNRPATISEIKQELTRVKQLCVTTYGICKDIEFNVKKKSTSCVDVNITKVVFDGVITLIDVYITMEVE